MGKIEPPNDGTEFSSRVIKASLLPSRERAIRGGAHVFIGRTMAWRHRDVLCYDTVGEKGKGSA